MLPSWDGPVPLTYICLYFTVKSVLPPIPQYPQSHDISWPLFTVLSLPIQLVYRLYWLEDVLSTSTAGGEHPIIKSHPLFLFSLMNSFIQVVQQPKQLVAQVQAKPDPYYSHENAAHLCTCFITQLFACHKYPTTSSGLNMKLPYFITYTLHWTKLHSSVTSATLVTQPQLKAQFPTTHGSSGHQLYIFTFIITSKVICDDT